MNVAPAGAFSAAYPSQLTRTPPPTAPAPAPTQPSNDGDGDSDKGGVDIRV